MLFKNPRSLLNEAASADLLNPEVSDEVKEVINDLEDTLTNNVEEVKEEDKTTNGGIPVVAEAVSLMECAGYGEAQYLVALEDVIAVKEAEGEEAAKEAMEEPGAAPSAEEVEAAEPEKIIKRYSSEGCTPTCALVPISKGRTYSVAPLS